MGETRAHEVRDMGTQGNEDDKGGRHGKEAQDGKDGKDGKLALIRDVLDSQLVDRHGRDMGRVDGLVAELRDGRPPRVVRIECGMRVLAARVHPRLGAWAAALSRWFSPRGGKPVRVDWADVRTVGPDIALSVDADQTGAL